jgi:cobalamin biosynthesis protein CbiD
MITISVVKSLIELSTGIIMVAGLIFKLAKMEQSIYSKIDNVSDYSRENTIKINAQLEMINYKLDDVTNKFHQIDRTLRENNIQVKTRKNDI